MLDAIAAERLAPADDAGDGLLVHAILQRHHETVWRQILPDQHRRPGGVVGFHADESDVDRLFLGELLRVGDVERAQPGTVNSGSFIACVTRKPCLRMCSTCAGHGSMKVTSSPPAPCGRRITADRARSNKGYFPCP